MKTDTPRTDRVVAPYLGCDVSVPECDALLDHSRQLERELAAATARIAKLEEAGDRLHDAIWSVQDWNGTRVGDRADDWMRAYDEGKP